MGKSYRVAKDNGREKVSYDYPADQESLRMILAAGGRSKLSPEQISVLKLKKVGPGDDCSDMPEDSLAIFLERGWVEEVPETKSNKPPRKKDLGVVNG